MSPLRSAVSSSIVGLMCLVIKMVRFASRMSTQSRISFGHLGLGGVTILDTHSVGPEAIIYLLVLASVFQQLPWCACEMVFDHVCVRKAGRFCQYEVLLECF